VIPANTVYRHQNQFIVDLQEDRPAGVTKASTSVIESRIERQLHNPGCNALKAEKANIRGIGSD